MWRRQQHLGKGVSPKDDVGNEDIYAKVPLRRYVTATMFLWMNMAISFYWIAFPLVNSIFLDGYPQAGTPPSPGTYMSARYTWDWWVVWLLGLNMFLPLLFALALTNNAIEEYTRLHRYFARLAMFSNLIVVAVLTVQWILLCNGTTRWFGLQCSDYRWCCVNFPSVWCPNTTPCMPAVVNLDRNFEQLQHWVFSFVFELLAYWHTSINKDLREFGVLH
jgi:hypothetical protein